MKFLGPKVVDDVVRHDTLGNHYDDNDGAGDGDNDDDDGNNNNGSDDQVVVGDDMMISTSHLGELHLQLGLLDQRGNHGASRSPDLQVLFLCNKLFALFEIRSRILNSNCG